MQAGPGSWPGTSVPQEAAGALPVPSWLLPQRASALAAPACGTLSPHSPFSLCLNPTRCCRDLSQPPWREGVHPPQVHPPHLDACHLPHGGLNQRGCSSPGCAVLCCSESEQCLARPQCSVRGCWTNHTPCVQLLTNDRGSQAPSCVPGTVLCAGIADESVGFRDPSPGSPTLMWGGQELEESQGTGKPLTGWGAGSSQHPWGLPGVCFVVFGVQGQRRGTHRRPASCVSGNDWQRLDQSPGLWALDTMGC